MSPLGEAVYAILSQRVGLNNPLVTYHGLVKSLPPLDPPDNDITRNDERLFRALGEVGHVCRDHGLPTLTALVIRSVEQSPGSGYYHEFHPETGNDAERQRKAWEQEIARLKTTNYPPSLEKRSPDAPHKTSDDHRESGFLGILRIADDRQKRTALFGGHITCSQCAKSIDIEVERNPKAVSAKQPAFVINETGKTPRDKPLGQLFIGTILSSPVLYYGSVNHCDREQRITLFFNRALRDRSDHHLTIMQSNSGQPDVSHDASSAHKDSTKFRYPVESEFIGALREGVKACKPRLEAGYPVEIGMKLGGYEGKGTVLISPDDRDEFEVAGPIKDPVRFSRRLRVAAWALFQERVFGRFVIEYDRKSGIVTIEQAEL